MLAFWMLLSVAAGALAADGSMDSRAQEVIERTRQTHASYSVFTWNRITPDDAVSREEWSAEFNKGNLHRVETPRDRLIADCDSQTGVYFGVETGKVVRGASIAKAACGIQANSTIVSASFDGSKDGPFGTTDRLTVRDLENVRTYEVAKNGAIVGETIESQDRRVFLNMTAQALLHNAPDEIFSEASLATSAVPERYRHAPN